ncbi:hypothetical protein CUT44_24225 [Streptomyces carminius]|uniref:Uncharacterized protein n=1 Tax=Streptomyces carminius TaxID=2665496 RepID=A0A2M8LTV7_9ACTN|nr:hypothetical protein [Streptomyces carminius]PJE95387.1 hypothetical protein CUT44_24225 [Streptomyces carminius]
MPGHEHLLTRVIPELVMQNKLRPSAGSRLRARGGPPAIEITGLGETERDELLKRLCRRYRRVLPVNDPAEMPLSPGRTVDSLWYLSTRVYGLGDRVNWRRPIRFPRFALGLTAYAWAEKNDRPGLAEIERMHEWLERELRKRSDGNPRPAGEVLADLEASLAAVGGLVGGGAATTAVMARTLLARRRVSRVALRWWERVLRTPSGTFARRETVATELFRVFGGDRGGRKPSREQFLAAALLADIDAHYGLRRRLNRDLLPVILLPEYKDGGREFLDTLLWAYDIAFPHRPGKRTVTRPVVIAVADGKPGEPEAGPLERLELELSEWKPQAKDGVRKRWVLRVAATEPGEGR